MLVDGRFKSFFGCARAWFGRGASCAVAPTLV
jgi:hypothetical protein